MQEAKTQVAECMRKKVMQLSVYGADVDIRKNCKINSYKIAPAETDTSYEVCWANLKVSINYTAPSLDIVGKAIAITKDIELYFLCPRGDINIPQSVLNKIWKGGRKPDTVAVDSENGDIYCVYLNDDNLSLEYFGTMEIVYRDLISDNLNCEKPYEFGVDKKALYDFIVGDEGWNNIRNNIYIQFNNANGIRVYKAKGQN